MRITAFLLNVKLAAASYGEVQASLHLKRKKIYISSPHFISTTVTKGKPRQHMLQQAVTRSHGECHPDSRRCLHHAGQPPLHSAACPTLPQCLETRCHPQQCCQQIHSCARSKCCQTRLQIPDAQAGWMPLGLAVHLRRLAPSRPAAEQVWRSEPGSQPEMPGALGWRQDLHQAMNMLRRGRLGHTAAWLSASRFQAV